MSKKKFSRGFDSLFGDIAEEKQQQLALFPEPEPSKKSPKVQKDKTPSKDFSAELQSFLTEAFEESFEKQMAAESLPVEKAPRRKAKTRKKISGLDALIRSTIEPQELEPLPEKNTKRVTLVIDKEKLSKLKTIARAERTYIKDIIDDMVSEFISQYEKSDK